MPDDAAFTMTSEAAVQIQHGLDADRAFRAFLDAKCAGALPVSNRHDGTRTLADVDAEMAGINWRGE